MHKFLAFLLTVGGSLLIMSSVTFAQVADDNRLPLNPAGYDSLLVENRASKLIDPNTANTGDAIRQLFVNPDGSPSSLVVSGNIIIAAMALLFIMIVALRFMFASGDEEKLKTAKGTLGFIIIGLMIVSAALNFAFFIFNPEAKNFLTDDTVSQSLEAFINQIKLLAQIVIGAFAALTLVMSGYKLITSQGSEEAITQETAFIKNFLLAAGMIALAEVLVKGVFYARNGNTFDSDTAAGIGLAEIVGVINFLLGFVAVAATFMLVLASLYYVISLGDEDRAGRAKRIIFSSIFGIIIAISAYTIVTYFTQL